MSDRKDNIGGEVTLLLTGDIMLGGEFLKFKNEKKICFDYAFKNLKKVFEDVDIVFGNLECTLSKNGTIRADKGSILYAPPDSISALKYLNYDIVSLGNNHINDYGEEGLIKTLETLRNNRILFFGAGRNLEEANKEAIIEINGIKICFLGYTTNEAFVKSIIADEDTAGCVYYDFKKIKKDIERVKPRSDIICLSLHWGHEFYRYPSPEQVKLAHKIIEVGAHIVIGHHPHITQGFERYKHGIIFYSLGNFFFPDFYDKSGFYHEWSDENNKSISAKCYVINGNIGNVEILYNYMNANYQMALLESKDKEKAISDLKEISNKIKENNYEKFWEDYNKKRSKELKAEQLLVRWPKLLKRMKELGIRGCIKKASMSNIKEAGITLIRYLIFRIKQGT